MWIAMLSVEVLYTVSSMQFSWWQHKTERFFEGLPAIETGFGVD